MSWGVYSLRGGDALYVRWNGGGYGDPIARTPAAEADDVRSAVVSAGEAEQICGVALTAAGEADLPATTALRASLRQARLAPREAAE